MAVGRAGCGNAPDCRYSLEIALKTKSLAPAGIFRLDAYRARREQRRRLAASLYRADPARADLLDQLDRIAALVGADRAATVWVDEYGPGLVHPHVVLDLLSDRPRRAFPAEPLRRAWEAGVPGIHESAPTGPAKQEGAGWLVAVALGSDGTRSWFLVADAVSAGRPLTAAQRDRLMFLAGECSAVVLHRDLDTLARSGGDEHRTRPRFAGWPILQDIEGREDDDAESRRIALRFLVARLPRLLVEDDLAVPRERLRQQADRAREEMARDAEGVDPGPEGVLWSEVLDAFQAGELERLGRALVTLGDAVEGRLHLHGAVELYQTAYELFAATGCAEAAVDAARFAGRALRRLARWEESLRWYGIAREVAASGELPGKVAVVLDGTANVFRERGNLPAARATLVEALPFAEESGLPEALGGVYHGLSAAEHMLGNLDEAMAWGWKAVEAYEESSWKVRALASLGGVLIDTGDLDAAVNAWSCVRYLSDDDYYRIYAVDALGHIAALRGDRSRFAALSAQADGMGWNHGPLPAKAEILHYRGLSYLALGDRSRARAYLEEAVSFAEKHGFNRTLFEAERSLKTLTGVRRAPTPRSASPAPAPLRSGLEELRLRLEGAAAR